MNLDNGVTIFIFLVQKKSISPVRTFGEGTFNFSATNFLTFQSKCNYNKFLEILAMKIMEMTAVDDWRYATTSWETEKGY